MIYDAEAETVDTGVRLHFLKMFSDNVFLHMEQKKYLNQEYTTFNAKIHVDVFLYTGQNPVSPIANFWIKILYLCFTSIEPLT